MTFKHRMSAAQVSASTTITYPYPQRPRRSALGESGQHGGVDPNFQAYSGRTQRRPMRFTCLRRSSLATHSPEDRQKQHRFDTPIGYMKMASELRLRRSEALSRTRWQVKDSNLRSFRDGLQSRDGKSVSSQNASPPTTSVRIPHKQPVIAGDNRTPRPGMRS